MSGLISRVVFIWPSWDEKDHTQKYERITFGLVWYVPDSKTLNKPAELCECQVGNSSAGIGRFTKLTKFSANCHLGSDWTCFVEHKLKHPSDSPTLVIL